MFFLVLFFRIITTGEKLITNYPIFDNYDIYLRLEYFVFFWIPALGIQFLNYLFPKEINKKVFSIYYVIAIVSSFSLLLKPKYFTYTVPILQPVLIIALAIIKTGCKIGTV